MIEKIGYKKILIFTVIIAVLVVASVYFVYKGMDSFFSFAMQGRSSAGMTSLKEEIKSLQEYMLDKTDLIAADDSVINAVEKRDAAELLRAVMKFRSGTDIISITDTQGNAIVRAHSDKKGDSIMYQEGISSAITVGARIATLEKGTTSPLSVRACNPIRDHQGKIIGAVLYGRDLTNTDIIDRLKIVTGCEITLFMGDTRIATTITEADGRRVVGTKAPDMVIRRVLEGKQEYKVNINLFGKQYDAMYSPIVSHGTAIGMYFAGAPIDDIVMAKRTLFITIFINAILLLLLICITVLIIRYISEKIAWYEHILDAVPHPISVTDMDKKWTFVNKSVEKCLNLVRTDAIGRPCSDSESTICAPGKCVLDRLAQGERRTFFNQKGMNLLLSCQYIYNKNDEKIGHVEVVQNITELIKKEQEEERLLREIEKKVKVEEKLIEDIKKIENSLVEITDSAVQQTGELTKRSLETAAEIEKIYSLLGEITQKTKDNANRADSSVKLTHEIEEGVKKVSKQMNQLTQAMNAISKSNQDINKVIALIENIAGLTDLLSINASIEAANAGVHGRGFAIIAEEVSKLASQSSDSLKETVALLEESTEKSLLGKNIAKEVLLSMQEIISEIVKNTELAKEIFDDCNEQERSIVAINDEIGQIHEKTKENTAATEKLAEANGKIDTSCKYLKQLVGGV